VALGWTRARRGLGRGAAGQPRLRWNPRSSPPRRAGAAALFGTIARLTGNRSLHPAGVAFDGRLAVHEPRLHQARLFSAPGERPAAVRFSRGFGLPQPLPEILSIAIKVPGAYGPGADQDLLLTAAGDRPLLRQTFFWGRSHLDRHYSSVLPLKVGARQLLFGAVPVVTARMDGNGDLDELVRTVAAGGLAFDLRVAATRGAWVTVARIELGDRLDAPAERALTFSSDNTGGGIEPTGLINRVRGAAYAASHGGRPTS